MKKTTIISGLALVAAMSLSAFAQTAAKTASNKVVPAATQAAAPQTAPAKPAKMTRPAKTAKVVPQSDSDIQACIQQKLAAAPKLKTQGFNVAVSGGAATFTGTAANPGSKGGVSGIAKSCGAKQIVNNITIQAAAKPAPKK